MSLAQTLSLVEELERELKLNSLLAHQLDRRRHLLREALVMLIFGEHERVVQVWLESKEAP